MQNISTFSIRNSISSHRWYGKIVCALGENLKRNATLELLRPIKMSRLSWKSRSRLNLFFFFRCPKSICHSWKMICRQFFFVKIYVLLPLHHIPEIVIYFLYYVYLNLWMPFDNLLLICINYVYPWNSLSKQIEDLLFNKPI